MTSVSVLEASLAFLDGALNGLKSDQRSGKPLVIGISGPQGSGKSYLSSILEETIIAKYALKARVFSLDDLYLTHEEQLKVNEQGNVLLKGRGLPGTHDLKLFSTIDKIVHGDGEGRVYIPRYDKSLFAGEGDRTDGEWIDLKGGNKVDVIILEGWFFGFVHLDDKVVKKRYHESEMLQSYELNDVLQVNHNLKEYESLWNSVDYSILYSTDDIDNVVIWRTQQEHQLIKEKGKGMTDEQVRSFVERYMVVYQLYYWHFVKYGIFGKKNLKISIELDRTVSKVEEI